MPPTMSSCLNSCGLCGSAYQEPGRRRAGTRKSRAPSGVDRVSVGVSTSTKPALVQHLAGGPVDLAAQPHRGRGPASPQVEVAVLEPDLLADLGVLVDGERQRRRLRQHGERGGRRPRWRRSAARGSRCPRAACTTSPMTCTQNSVRSRCARSAISPSRNTTWAMPDASRRSMKITPPWSRRRATQPARVTVCPTCSARRVPARWLRITDSRLSGHPGAPANRFRPRYRRRAGAPRRPRRPPWPTSHPLGALRTSSAGCEVTPRGAKVAYHRPGHSKASCSASGEGSVGIGGAPRTDGGSARASRPCLRSSGATRAASVRRYSGAT